MWLAELFTVVQGAGLKFRLGLADEIIFGSAGPGRPLTVAAHNRIQELKAEARKRVGGQHRAKLDVQYLIELHNLAKRER